MAHGDHHDHDHGHSHGGLAGGFTAGRKPDDEIRGLFETAAVREAVKARLGLDEVSTLTVDEYFTQVVAGVNYKLHATVNGSKKVVIRAFRSLSGGLEIKEVAEHHD